MFGRIRKPEDRIYNPWSKAQEKFHQYVNSSPEQRYLKKVFAKDL